MADIRTPTDPRVPPWALDDAVIRLRVWASDDSHVLPSPPHGVMIGSVETCAICIEDRLVSREHVQLMHVQGRWVGIDVSKNGTLLDGVRTGTFTLAPGSEIGMGETTMVAESARGIELRSFVGRILGWSGSRLEAVDRALRILRRAAVQRSVLYLRGNTDLVPIAHSLHRYISQGARPFVMCDPRRGDVDQSVRSVANKPTGVAAYAAAEGGTLCIRSDRLPADFARLLQCLRRPRSSVLLVVVGNNHLTRHGVDAALEPQIHVPSIGERAEELGMIIDHYALDAAAELVLPRSTFTIEDRAWVLAHAASSFGEIEKATLRLVALRASHSLTTAADRLHMAPVSLTRWLGRRALPPSLERKMRR